MINNEDLTGTQQSQIIPSNSSSSHGRNDSRNDSRNNFTDYSFESFTGKNYVDNHGDSSRRFDRVASVKTRDMWLPAVDDNRNDRAIHFSNYNNGDYHNNNHNGNDNDNDNDNDNRNDDNSDHYGGVAARSTHPAGHLTGPSKGPSKEVVPIIPAMDRPSHWVAKPRVIKRSSTQADTKNKRSKGTNGRSSLGGGGGGAGGGGGRNSGGGGAGGASDRSLAGTSKSRSLQSGKRSLLVRIRWH